MQNDAAAAAAASGSVLTVAMEAGGVGVAIGLAVGIALTVAFSRRAAVTESADDLEFEWDNELEFDHTATALAGVQLQHGPAGESVV